jgi:hypothetical protein
MGLLDTPNAGVDANPAVPDAARSLAHAVAVAVAAGVVTSLTARCSPLVERCSLSVVHSPLSVERGPSFAPTQGAARRSSGYPTSQSIVPPLHIPIKDAATQSLPISLTALPARGNLPAPLPITPRAALFRAPPGAPP